MELSDEIYERIQKLCSDGDSFAEKSLFDEANKKYLEALELVPEPKIIWEASTWIYTALGDVCFLKKDFGSAKEYLYNAMNCPDGIANPFINMRLGEVCAEMGDNDKAKEYLLRAYALDGRKVFQNQDRKYLDIIKDEIKKGKKSKGN